MDYLSYRTYSWNNTKYITNLLLYNISVRCLEGRPVFLCTLFTCHCLCMVTLTKNWKLRNKVCAVTEIWRSFAPYVRMFPLDVWFYLRCVVKCYGHMPGYSTWTELLFRHLPFKKEIEVKDITVLSVGLPVLSVRLYVRPQTLVK